MPDNQLDILIKFGLSKEKATEAVAEIKKIETATKEGGKTAVKAEEQVEEATKKTFTSKKQLKDMVKQLGHEFPLLGSLGRLALNPIAFTTASIVAGFQIWKRRTDELTKALGGVEMANFTETQLERIERMATAMQKMATAATGPSQFAKIKTDAESMIQLVKDNDELFKAMGIDTGTTSLSDQARIKSEEADALEKKARALRAAAGTPMSKDKEDWLAGRIGEDEKMAEEKLKEFQSRRDDVAEYRASGSRNIFARAGLAAKFLTRYGRDLTPDQAMEREQANIDEQQSRINRFKRFRTGAALRAGDRNALETAAAGESDAASLRAEVTALRRQMAVQTAARLLPGSPHPQGGVSDPQGIRELLQYMNENKEFRKVMRDAILDQREVTKIIGRKN